MSFDWNEYLRLARQLGGTVDDAAKRSAVSRAYYSAFHAASLSLKTNKVATNPRYERDRHLKVWDIYMRSMKRDCRRIGNSGQRLKFDRQDADYDPDSGFPNPRVQRCIAEATKLVANINTNVPESFAPTTSALGWIASFVRRFF